MNSSNDIIIKGDIFNGCLCVQIRSRKQCFWKEKKIDSPELSEPELQQILAWLLNVVKPLFYDLPVDSVVTQGSQACLDKYKNLFDLCHQYLNITNNVIKKFSDFKGFAKGKKGILFCNHNDDSNFKSIYRRLKQKKSGKIEYMNYDPGFNAVERRWEKTPIPFKIEEMLAFFKEKKIGKMLAVNHYFLERYLQEGLYLPAFFKFIGFEYIIFDHDPYDQAVQGYLTKSFFHCNDFNRYSYLYYHAHWDKTYGLEKIHRVPFTTDYARKFSFAPLPEKPKVVVISNARVPNVVASLMPTLFLLQQFNEENLFEEIDLWFNALRYMILNVMDLSEFERLKYNSALLNLTYHMYQFFKYEAVHCVADNTQIDVYGDKGWEILFPQQYRGYLKRDGMVRLFEKKEHVYLLFNWYINWIEASPSVYDAINFQAPFLNYPTLVKTEELRALENVEYRNFHELKEKLENTRLWTGKHVEDAVNFLTKTLDDELEITAGQISGTVKSGRKVSVFADQFRQHDEIMRQKAVAHIDRNYDFLRFTFQSLFLKPARFNPAESRYYHRDYVQKLLQMKFTGSSGASLGS